MKTKLAACDFHFDASHEWVAGSITQPWQKMIFAIGAALLLFVAAASVFYGLDAMFSGWLKYYMR